MHDFLDTISLPEYANLRDPLVMDYSGRPVPWQNIAWTYYDWYLAKGKQNVVLSEFPFLIQANSLCNYIGLENLFENDVYFAGVIDALVWDGEKFIVKDYKTYRALKDYPENPLYDLDQLGMYCVALFLIMGIAPDALVEKIQANYTDIRKKSDDGQPRVQSKTDDPSVVNRYGSTNRYGKRTNYVVNKAVNKRRSATKKRQKVQSKSNPGPKSDISPSSPRKEMHNLSFPAGNGRYRKMGILREYYSFTPNELKSTVRDFIAYILAAEELIHSPNLPYFSVSKYSDVSEEYYDLALALRRGEPIEPILQERYVKYPTNEEVTRAIRTWQYRATLLDSRRCPVVESVQRSLEIAKKLTEGGPIHV